MKILLAILVSMMMLGLTMAIDISSDADVNLNVNANSGIGSQLNVEIRAQQEVLREGSYNGSFGQLLNVKMLSENFRELRQEEISVKTKLNLTIENDDKNETHIRAHFENGSESEIKIMPSTASETALARLRLKVCSLENNCTIELKEVAAKANYEIKADQKVKVLGLFNARMHVESQISAETGEVISAKVPWWNSISTTV